MKVELALSKSDEDEAYDGREFDVPALPRPGDQIWFRRHGKPRQYFIVKDVVWQMTTSVAQSDIEGENVMEESGVTDSITIICDHDPSAA